MIQPPSKRGEGRVSGRGSSREHSQTNRKFPTKAPRKNKLRDALFFIFCLKNSRIFPTIEEKKSLYGRKVSKMDFGISSAGSYGTNLSPYDWNSTSANGTKNAQGTDDNPLSNNATNPLQPEDDTSKNSATNDVRLKDDKDLTPEERRAKARRDGLVQGGRPYRPGQRGFRRHEPRAGTCFKCLSEGEG